LSFQTTKQETKKSKKNTKPPNKSPMKKIFFLLTITLCSLTHINAQVNTQDIAVEPKGIYKEIEVQSHNKVIEILNGEDKTLKQQTVDLIIKNPNNYNPPVIYALSKELFDNDQKEEATFWFYVAQLRARYDANLCLDKTAKQGVAILNNEYGPNINNYAFKNVEFLKKTVTKVVDFVKGNDENYDHRWLNLHGMDAVIAGMDENSEKKELSKPKNEWPKIKQTTIDEYYNGFTEYLKSIKNQLGR